VIPVANIDLSEVITCSQISISLSQNSLVENPANANYIWTSTPLPTIPSSTTFSGLGQVGPHAIEYSNDTSLVKTFAMLQIIENGCTSNVAVDSVEVFPIPISSFRVIPDKICSGQPTTFVFDGVIDTTCTNCPVNYAWSFPDGLPNTATGNSVAVIFQNATDFTAPKVGELRVTQKYTKGSTTLTCPGNNGAKPYTAPVMVHPLPKIEFAGPIEICDKATTYLSTSVKYVKYLWNDGTTNDTCIVNHGGDYAVQVTDINKCVNNAITHVTVHPIPVANAGDDQLIFVGNSAFLSASKSYGGDSYLWTPKTTVDDATTMNPIVSPTATTAYVLTYYNAAVGCTDYDTVVIKVRDCEPLIVPNAFTPNGDNIDDNFMILNPNDYYRLIRMEIYNRWGELVYATNDKNNKGWDGMYRGSAQEVGTYIYHITAECGGGKLLNLKGDVTLLK
jgi:gliding motility-associated-like protein